MYFLLDFVDNHFGLAAAGAIVLGLVLSVFIAFSL